jgi:hypothetical protein
LGLDQQAATEKKQLELTLEPCQMIIQLDAWNIRERDGWDRSQALRRQGQAPDAFSGKQVRLGVSRVYVT